MKRKGKEKGKDSVPPEGAEKLPGLALRAFRAAHDANQEELSRALGRGLNYVSRLEKGMVERPVFEQVTELFNAPPAAVDWSVDFVTGVNPKVLVPGKSGGFRLRHRRVAVELGRWIEELAFAGLEEAGPEIDAEEEARRVQILVERLRWRKHATCLGMVRESADYHLWRFARRLCEESLAATADSADRAREWAELAVIAARHAPGEEERLAREQGNAIVHLANALRVKGELRAADQAYAEGCKLWDQGADDEHEPLNEARVLGFGASLRRAQRRFKEALELLDRALEVDTGDEAPYLLLNRSNLLREIGDLEGAVTTLRRADPHLSKVSNPRLVLAAELNAVDHLSILGQFEEASRRLPRVWELAEDWAGELDRFRLVWVEGRVAAGTGQENEGISALEQVWREFHQRGMAFDAALAALELAALRLRRGESGHVRALARQIRPVFESQEVHREALAALAFFCQAAEQERATLDFVERLVRYLHRARHNPELRFELQP